MNWIKKNWHLFLGSVALVTAVIILFVYNNSGEAFEIKLLQSIYYSLTLILMEGGNFAFPSHAPLSIQILLWICYFAAPLLTLTFIIRYIQERFFNSIPKRLKNHIIICGLGRNGKIIYDLASKKFPNKRIVIIEKDESNANANKFEKQPKTWWLKKDFSELPVLKEARVEHADKIYITTNHDLDNLTTLMNALNESQDICEFNCHIGEIQLYNNIEKVFTLEKTKAEKKRLTNVKLFNGYRIATKRLFEDKIFKEGKLSPNGNIYIIFGFGRFGQMLYNHIVNHHFNMDRDFVVIVSLNSSLLNDPRNYTWSKEKIIEGIKPNCIIGDMNDYSIWDTVIKKINKYPANKGKPVLLFNCRDSDIANINLAISLKTNSPELLQKGTVYCRTYSSTSKDMENILEYSLSPGKNSDVILFPVYRELEEAFRGELFN